MCIIFVCHVAHTNTIHIYVYSYGNPSKIISALHAEHAEHAENIKTLRKKWGQEKKTHAI